MVEAYVSGVSQRKMGDVTEALLGERHDVEKALSRPGVEVYQPQLRVGVPWSLSDTLGGVWLG